MSIVDILPFFSFIACILIEESVLWSKKKNSGNKWNGQLNVVTDVTKTLDNSKEGKSKKHHPNHTLAKSFLAYTLPHLFETQLES